MPIGSKGVSMVNIRDIGESAAIELLRRHRAPMALSRETYGLVGPDALNGEQVAGTIWGEALAKSNPYATAADAISLQWSNTHEGHHSELAPRWTCD